MNDDIWVVTHVGNPACNHDFSTIKTFKESCRKCRAQRRVKDEHRAEFLLKKASSVQWHPWQDDAEDGWNSIFRRKMGDEMTLDWADANYLNNLETELVQLRKYKTLAHRMASSIRATKALGPPLRHVPTGVTDHWLADFEAIERDFKK